MTRLSVVGYTYYTETGKGEGEWREKGCETGQEEKGTPSTISSTGSGYTQSVESVIVPDGEVCNTITLCTTLCPYKVQYVCVYCLCGVLHVSSGVCQLKLHSLVVCSVYEAEVNTVRDEL